MRRTIKAAAAFAVIIGTAAMATPAAASQAAGGVGTQIYGYITNLHSGLCVAVAGGSTANNAQIVQYYCDGEASRFWQLELIASGQYRIRNLKSGKCLAIAGGSAATGAYAVLFTCDDHISRRWRLDSLGGGNFHIVNLNSGKCLTVENASTAPNAKLLQYPCNTTWPHNETW